MTAQDKLDLAVDLADHTIDYIYETVATQLDWHDFNVDDEYDEDQFMIALDEVMRLTTTEITKRLTNINGVSTLLTNMK
jgi:hypothetical protein